MAKGMRLGLCWSSVGAARKPEQSVSRIRRPTLAASSRALYLYAISIALSDRRLVGGGGRRGICSVLSAVQSADVSSQTPCGTHFSRRSIGVAEPLPGSLGDVFPVAHMIVSFHPSALKK